MAFKGIFPAAKLTPAPFGLFSVADVKKHGGGDEHWIARFDQESEACAFDTSIIDVCGGVEPVSVFDTNDGLRYIPVSPFGIVAKDACLTPGWSVTDRKARVLRQLELITPKAIEVELWNGTFRQDVDGDDQGMYLSSDAAEVVETGAQKPKIGLALLEQALANCSTGFQGTIHMSPLVGTMIGMEMQKDGDTLYTMNGNKVVVGSGYDGRGPGDTKSPSNNFVHWVYATGPMFVHLGINELITVSLAEATNLLDLTENGGPQTNEMTFVAERPASVHWDGCCHLAVQVDVRL